ncbi:GNAT family N-acetyltransferase [Amnibacterium kyonggiense]
MSDVIVRAGGASDYVAAGALRWEWIVEENGGASTFTRADFVARFAAWAAAHSSTHHCFVAEVDGSVVGMAWLAVSDRVPSPRAMRRESADLQSVYVSRAFRGRRIGARLIDEVVKAASERGAERLTVHSSPEAISAYARAGLEATELLRSRTLNPVT